LSKEPLFVLLPRDHRLASRDSVRLQDMAGETFIGMSKTVAPALRLVIDEYTWRSAVEITTSHEAETLPMAISLVLSTGGVSLLPDYARRLLPPSVVSRPLRGKAPTVDLAIAYNKLNASSMLKLFLSKADELFDRESKNRR
jgi:LysR family transcriptional regulator, hca operon transcriptional activator